jgi:uncharacterized protein
MRISFRPHHFLCTLGFQGRGYSSEFIRNYGEIVEALHEHQELPLQVIFENDSICKVCPHQRGEGCINEEKIQGLDARHAAILHLKPRDILTWGQAKKRLKEKMSLENFHKACQGCSWKSLGVCEESLRKLQSESDDEKADS